MSNAPRADLTGWTCAPFTGGGYTHDVYRRDPDTPGPGVVLIPEMPGLTPEVLALGNHLVDNGFTVASPSLYGTPGAASQRPGMVPVMVRGCVTKEFAAFATDKKRPVTYFLRALARDLNESTPGKGVGIIGQCWSGGFALAAAVDDVGSVLDAVLGGAVDIDPDRVAVAGSSAGGALAAGLAQQAADRLVFQLLHQPVLDDRPSPSKEEFVDTPGFDGPAAELMWGHYLGADRPYDAVPAALADLTGLPPALITCSELDPLRDEAIDYALRLMWAGVATELHVFPGTCHGFDAFLPDWEVSRGLYGMQVAALRRVFYSEP